MLLPGVATDVSSSGEEIASLESYFSTAQSDCSEATRRVRVLLKALVRLEKATEGGDIGVIAKCLEEITAMRRSVEDALLNLTSNRMQPVEAAFRNEKYFKEIADLAAASSIAGVRSTEGRLFSYPYVIERKKSGTALSIGARTTKNIRPSAVLRALADARKRGSRFDPQTLLDAVETIYDVKRRSQATDLVAIDEVYRILTAMPGSEKEYPFLDFLANLDEIKRSGVLTGKTRRSVDLPAPSTTGKGGKAFRIIREDGREQLYHMLRFVPDTLA